MDPFGNVIVVDTYNNRILKFSRDGNLLFKLGADGGASGSEDGQFNFPRGVATDADGDIYVADTRNYRVKKFNPDGQYIGSIGSKSYLYEGPNDVVVDSQGYVYATDPAMYRVRKFTNDGSYVSSIGAGGGQLEEPRCLAVDAADNIYVTEYLCDFVVK